LLEGSSEKYIHLSLLEVIEAANENGLRGMLLLVLEDLDKGEINLKALRDKYKRMYKELCDRHTDRLKRDLFSEAVTR